MVEVISPRIATVTSAMALSDAQITSVRELLRKKLNESFDIEAVVDPSVLGGARIYVDGYLIDHTAKKQLSAIRSGVDKRIESGVVYESRYGGGIRAFDGADGSVASRIRAQVSSLILDEVGSYVPQPEIVETGVVYQVGDCIATVTGLYGAQSGELLEFQNGVYGIAMNLNTDSVGVVLMGTDAGIKEGDFVRLTGRVAEVPVGDALLGRVVDALGQPVDQKGPLDYTATRNIERVAPGVVERAEVSKPLQTGLKAIDAMVPIGRGQRELIIGDRQTGKTALCVDTILNQKDEGVLCIYVAIGQKASTVARVVKTLEDRGAMGYSTVVVSTASDPISLQYLAPYTGCAIGEQWMEEGKDVLIVYDDLSKHAVAYRALSLLLVRPPGREAYPGDVFYLHSRLLERAACLSPASGGGTMTALPIIETQAGDISAYIPTNVISITDGQIYLEAELFNHGIRPAINPGFSVSRVGGSAQIKAMRGLSGALRVELAQYRELASFSQFGSDLNQDTRDRLNHGERVVEVFKQMQYSPVPVEYQVIVLYMLTKRYFSEVHVEHVHMTERDLIRLIQREHSDIAREIKRTGVISPDLEERLKVVLEQFMRDRKAFMDYMRQNYSDIVDEISRNAQISADLRQRIRAVRREFVEYISVDDSAEEDETGAGTGADMGAGAGSGAGAGVNTGTGPGAGV